MTISYTIPAGLKVLVITNVGGHPAAYSGPFREHGSWGKIIVGDPCDLMNWLGDDPNYEVAGDGKYRHAPSGALFLTSFAPADTIDLPEAEFAVVESGADVVVTFGPWSRAS